MSTVNSPGIPLLLAFVAAFSAAPAPDVVGEGPPEFTPKAQEAVTRGLEWLRKNQRQDGAWDGNVGFKENEQYRITSLGPVRDPGITALAGTAMLAGGHLPGRGPYGDSLNRAIDYVLSCVSDKGY